MTFLSQLAKNHSLLWALAGGLVCLLLPLSWPTRVLLAWCIFCFSALIHFWSLAWRLNAKQTQARVAALDPSARIIFLGLSLAWFFSVSSIAYLLYNVNSDGSGERPWQLLLCLLGLVGAWLLIHTVFAFRYAHLFYEQIDPKALDFPGQQAPDYQDFLYFSCTIGMCAQVSDITIAKRNLRRLVLGHSLLSFAFNMVVLAMAVNVAAGLLH